MAESLTEIRTELKRHKRAIIKKYKVREIGIFGSFVRGEQKKRSDVDVLVEYNEEDIPSLLEFIAFERHLADILHKKVDLVRKEAIRPELRENILREVVYI